MATTIAALLVYWYLAGLATYLICADRESLIDLGTSYLVGWWLIPAAAANLMFNLLFLG